CSAARTTWCRVGPSSYRSAPARYTHRHIGDPGNKGPCRVEIGSRSPQAHCLGFRRGASMAQVNVVVPAGEGDTSPIPDGNVVVAVRVPPGRQGSQGGIAAAGGILDECLATASSIAETGGVVERLVANGGIDLTNSVAK